MFPGRRVAACGQTKRRRECVQKGKGWKETVETNGEARSEEKYLSCHY